MIAFCFLGLCLLVTGEADYQEAVRQEQIRKELSAPVRPQRCPGEYVMKRADRGRWIPECVDADLQHRAQPGAPK